ncbi:MAG: DUF839 domain-containing protein [Woeseiaceae bacterium]|nr:DUF839 domain-containing protein [Woeseiaceae bacterium]
MISRRRFLQTLAVTAATPTTVFVSDKASAGFGALVTDPQGLLDLPEGFSYSVIARMGEEMDDGLRMPGLPDGMAAFDAGNGTVKLICNHELSASQQEFGPFGKSLERLELVDAEKVYDLGDRTSPGTGGTSTIHYDLAAGERLGMHLSLAGTAINCSGGPTPWGSWLSCEETFTDPGAGFERGRVIHREKHHGYIFEVPVSADGLVNPEPLTSMGRFEHEAASVDPKTGIVYLTEDRWDSAFYRFIPNVPGKLKEGGRLQALKILERPMFDTRNWEGVPLVPHAWLDVEWVDLDDPDPDENDLRLRAQEQGGAIFARGEGICRSGQDFAFTATIGGPDRMGQIFVYRPSPAEGTDEESAAPARLALIAESLSDSMLRNADNLTLSPWGDLIVCEDTPGYCGMVAVRPDGIQYRIAGNSWEGAELAGVCFSPDGSTLFVNVQQAHVTLAITGPWSTPR